jgi:hypothetical protein
MALIDLMNEKNDPAAKAIEEASRAVVASAREIEKAANQAPGPNYQCIPSIKMSEPGTDEWIWVKGYKGTDKDMRCHGDYQFALDEQFDMPEGATIKECESGFHLCKNLKDVFGYYGVYNGNRFFEVRALVRKSDYYNYGVNQGSSWKLPMFSTPKLVSKSIIFIKELTVDEILKAYLSAEAFAEWTEADKKLCIQEGREAVEKSRKKTALTALGYSGTMASYILDKTDEFDLALALISQDGLTTADICHILFDKR